MYSLHSTPVMKNCILVPYHKKLFVIYDNGENEDEGGRKVQGVGVMKDKVVKVEEIEVSHTLGGSGEGRVQGRGKGRGCTFYSDTEQYTMGMWSWRNRHETCSDVFGRVVFSDFFL